MAVIGYILQDSMLIKMASEFSKKHTHKCVDCSTHNKIKGAKVKYVPLA